MTQDSRNLSRNGPPEQPRTAGSHGGPPLMPAPADRDNGDDRRVCDDPRRSELGVSETQGNGDARWSEARGAPTCVEGRRKLNDQKCDLGRDWSALGMTCRCRCFVLWGFGWPGWGPGKIHGIADQEVGRIDSPPCVPRRRPGLVEGPRSPV